MRKGLIVLAAAVFAFAGPARAQYVSPFSGNWLFGSPVTVDAIMGSAASDDSQAKTRCTTIPAGRDGVRYRCTTAPSVAASGQK
jgi:hypothetical protein